MNQETCLPNMEHQILNMKIVLVKLSDFPSQHCITKFDVTDDTSHKTALHASVYKIDNAETTGYLPSKVWYDAKVGSWVLLYYVSDNLPFAARPFGDKPCYVFTRRADPCYTIEYDPATRIFIDQSQHPEDGMTFLFIFGEDQLMNVLTTQWDGTSWANKVELY